MGLFNQHLICHGYGWMDAIRCSDEESGNGTAGSVDRVTCTRLRMMMDVNGIEEKAAVILQPWM